eukprot:289027-Alexandrium_andersonii.AAC.1
MVSTARKDARNTQSISDNKFSRCFRQFTDFILSFLCSSTLAPAAPAGPAPAALAAPAPAAP